MEVISKSVSKTKRTAVLLAKTIKKQSLAKTAFVIALEGDLGSGKTTFIQGLAKGLKIKESVLSPTFLILKQFPISFKKLKDFYHIDAYRLKNPEELLELGFKDLLNNPENLIVVEWADKIKKILPKHIMKIKFFNLGKNQRKISIL